jgi:hypothetical protein
MNIYEEYIATQLIKLEALEKQIVDTKKDIDNVRKLMLEYPNEVPHNN